MIDEQGINNLEGILKALNSKLVKTKDNINMQNTKNILDTLMLLANSEELLKQMEKLNLGEALDQVYSKDVDDIEV